MANEAMVKKGIRESLQGLRDQAEYHAELLKEHGIRLKKRGFTDANLEQFLKDKETVESKRAEQIEAREASKANTRTEAEAVTAAKGFKFDLDLAVDDAYAATALSGETLPVNRDAFHTGRLGQLKRSTPKLISYLSDVRPHVVALEAQLKPFFDDNSPVQMLDTVLADLKSAQGTQEFSLASLPLDTLELYEAKGRLLHAIESINRKGKAAGAGNAAFIALFNKDRLLAARRSQAKKDEQPAA